MPVWAALILLALVAAVGAQDAMWVFLVDKPTGSGRVTWPTPDRVGPDAALDRGVDEGYVGRLEALGVRLRQRSRWFNAVSVEATPDQIERIRKLAFVRSVQPVRALHRERPVVTPAPAPRRAQTLAPDYGPSLTQAAAVGATELHARDLLGQGVRVAVLDAGFNWRAHRAFSGLTVIGTRDFVNEDDEVGDEADEPVTGDERRGDQNHHGTSVLSVLAGDDPGHLVGIAPRAEYLLAKTEDTTRELPIQEDRWIPALEWADSLGARVVNASLGYNEFDDGTGYAYADLDGQTALSTRAAQLAVARGIVVVVAAGNEAANDWHYITAPADGRDVIAVGAVHAVSRSIAPFSSRGPTADGRTKPDVVAPGMQVVAASGRGPLESDSPGPFAVQEYITASGTSFAAPIVSGACALLLQRHPGWSPAEVAVALRTTAWDLGPAGPDTVFGWGLIDVARASGLDLTPPEANGVDEPFPNPARGTSPTVYFPMVLASSAEVSLAVFEPGGALVEHQAPRPFAPGTYTAPGLALAWRVGADLASGVYLYRLDGGSFHRVGKIAVVRGP